MQNANDLKSYETVVFKLLIFFCHICVNLKSLRRMLGRISLKNIFAEYVDSSHWLCIGFSSFADTYTSIFVSLH